MESSIRSAVLFLLVVLMISAVPAKTCLAWSNDPVVNNAVCTAFDHQYNHQMVTDGAGGAIITWQDYRDRYGTMSDIYAQRIDWKGKVLWTLDGVVVSIAPNDQVNPKMVTDGSGGAIIIWEDSRNGNVDIYSQRIDADGNLLWLADGVAICTTAHSQEYPQSSATVQAGPLSPGRMPGTAAQPLSPRELMEAGMCSGLLTESPCLSPVPGITLK